MSEPTGDQAGAQANRGRQSAPALKRLTVGHFRHRDHLLGTERDRFGVVVQLGDVLAVYPLEHYTVQVDPAEFTPINPDDLGDDEDGGRA